MQETPTDPKPNVEVFALTTTGGTVGSEIERVCTENELVISTWSPIHLRAKLKELYWKSGQSAAGAAAFFEDTLRYLYMPRFKNREVLSQAIRSGAASRDFFATAYGQSGEKFEGFQFGSGDIVFDDTLLLIEPESAKDYEEANRPAPPSAVPAEPAPPVTGGGTAPLPKVQEPQPGVAPVTAKPRLFHASVDVPAATSKMRLVQLADEIVSVLSSDPHASVRLVVEISAEFPEAASDTVKRAVSENARSLGLKNADWE